MSKSQRQAENLLKRLEWTVVRRLDGVMQGDYRTLFRGLGLDFADLREYQFHDDIRYIDWNVTARTGVPHVRVFNEDRDLTGWFLLDLSPSVDFGSGNADKRQMLTEFVAVLARLLAGRGNKVGAILFDGIGEHVVPARAGRRHLAYMLDKILAHPRRLRAPQTDLGGFLRRSAAAIRRRSVVFVVSDFISVPGWEAPLSMVARRHDAVAVRLLDPLETNLPDIGLLDFIDAETGERVLVDTSEPGLRQRFAQIAQDWNETIVGGFSRAGVDALELSTDADLFEVLLGFMNLRKGLVEAGRKGAAA